MKDNIEKSLKRFLKRKAKITMGFITAFLITGSIGYALTITEDKLQDNTWTNESKIEEQIEVSESLLDKGVNISNNREIVVNTVEETLNGENIKNGIGIFSNNKIKIGNINNNSTISGNMNGTNIDEVNFMGNGISIYSDSLDDEVEIGNIVNNGIISGNMNGNLENKKNVYTNSNNGILIFSYNGNTNGKTGNIVNNGVITGNIVAEKLSDGEQTGNGIFLFTAKIEDLINNGEITGNFKGNELIIKGSVGNGICIGGENVLSINNIINNGKIAGNISSKELIEGELIGTGIFLISDENLFLGDIINNGIISGNVVTKKLNDGYFNGNGMIIKSSNLIGDNITNNGIISGNMNGNLLKEKPYYSTSFVTSDGIMMNIVSNLILNNINNNGVIRGNLDSKDILAEIGGNGFTFYFNAYENGTKNIVFNTINNNGKILGIGKGNILEDSNILNNGISFFSRTNDERNISITNLKNAGLIKGEILGNNIKGEILGNGISFFIDKSLDLGNIINNGIISGNVTGNIENGSLIGNGISFFIDDNILTIGNINNTGVIKGKISEGNLKEIGGNGIYSYVSKFENITNNGIIMGNNTGLNVSKDDTFGKLNNYSNAGIVAGKTPVFAEGFTDDLAKSADKGVAIKLDDKGNIASITNGNGGEVNGKKVINADITDKDSSISVDKETTYANNIINGAGVNSATLNVNAKTSVTDSIINAFATALKVNDGKEFSASNTAFNGGGLDGNTAVITDEGNSTISLDKSTINGNIALGSGDSKLAVTNSQINGDIAGGEGNDNLTVGGSSLYNKIEGFEDITFKGNTTLYETAKVTGANKIEIDGGTEVNLRVDSTKKDDDGTYKEHALFNSSDKLLTLAGNTNAITENDVDKDGNLNVEENEGRVNYDKVSILNLVTSGLGLKSKIDLGNTKVDDTLWVKTDSILTQATKQENDKGTILNIEAEKDLFSINKKFDNPEPDKPVNPDKPVDPKPDKPVDPDVDPDKPIDPKPDKPQHSIKYYNKLNDIYKGIYSSNDKNFNALNDIVVNYTFSDKDKGNYPIIGNDKAQMETLLGYLSSVYTQNPYAFSNQATRKAMNLFHDSVRDNNFKANNDEWLIYGGLLHQSGDQEQTYYGRNYHGFDTGTADVDADIKLTGAYGQFEYGLSDSLATGIMVGGSKSEVEVGPSKVKGTGAYVGAYAKKDINNFRFTTGLGYQYSEYDGNRRTINEAYSSDYQDQAINLYVDGKYSHDLGNNLFLEPKAGLSYTHIDQDSIKENDKALALDIEAKDFDVLEGTVGVDIKKVIPTEKGTHTLTAGISYNHILDGDNADSLRANYGGSKFDVLVPHKNKGQVSLGAKYEVELENGMFYDVKGNYYVPTDSKDSSNKNADKGEWRVGVGFGYKF